MRSLFCFCTVALFWGAAAQAQVESAYSNAHPSAAHYNSGGEEELNLDSELAVEARFNLPQHKAPRQPLLDLDASPPTSRRLASETKPQADKPDKAAAGKSQELEQKLKQTQAQLDDTRQQNQDRAKYLKVLKLDFKKAQSQLQQLQLELQQAQNESQRYIQATKKLNKKIKKMDEKIKATTRQIANTYHQQDEMKAELQKNLKEYKKKLNKK